MVNTPKPTALYLRVSTRNQVGEDRFGLDVQLRDAQNYARANGLHLAETYQDVITGTRATRDALDRLLNEASRFDTVLVSGVDRLARRVPISYAVLAELLGTGVQVHSADMGLIDPTDEMSSLNFGVRSVFAQSEHMRIAKRLKGGMLAKVRSGKPVVPIHSYGWNRGELLEEEAQWVREMYRWAREGQTQHQITLELNRLGVPRRTGSRWGASTVKYILKNPLYKGLYTFGKARTGRGDGRDLVTCEVEAIVPPADWDATQRAMTSRSTGGRPSSTDYADQFPLAKRMTCGLCGGGMTAVVNPPHPSRPSQRTPYLFYHCYRIYRRDGYYGDKCTHTRSYGVKKLHPFVMETLKALLTDDAALLAALPTEPVKVLNIEPAVAAIEKRLKNLKLLALDGGLSPAEYKETREELEGQRAALSAAPAPLVLTPDGLPRARERVRDALAEDNLHAAVIALDLRLVLWPGGKVDLKLNGL